MQKKQGIHLSTLAVLAITVGIVTAIAIFTAFFSASYKRSLTQYAYTASEQSVKQTAEAVENYISSMKNKLYKINEAMHSTTTTEDFHKIVSAGARLEDDIQAVMVYDTAGNLLSCGTEDGMIKNYPHKNLSFSVPAYLPGQDYALSDPHVQTIFEQQYPWVVTISRQEQESMFGRQVIIAIDFSFSEIAKYIDKVGIGRRGYCYIVDSQGRIIYHPQQQMIFSGLKEENSVSMAGMEDGIHSIGDRVYTLQSMPTSGWRIVGVTYNDEITQNVRRQVSVGVIVSVLLCLLITLAVSHLFYRCVNRPVRQLVQAMQKFEKTVDEYQYEAIDGNVAELKTLSNSFEHMVGMIQYLLEKVRKEEITLRKTELKALQAQINPHFLYNTLDSIQWMCEQGKSTDAVEMVGALARLFRISISHGNELIPIADELRHAESYLIIQSFRYKNQFTYHFHVDEELKDCLCNKITIQPFIENAIYHGLDRMVDPGYIDISVFQEGEDILITVEDNGVGMTQEQCRQVLEKGHSDSQGIGVKNVNDRLKIYFGEQYGIRIDSELDVGTKVTIRMPKLRKEPPNEK